MSTEVWEDYVKLGDLKRPPVVSATFGAQAGGSILQLGEDAVQLAQAWLKLWGLNKHV